MTRELDLDGRAALHPVLASWFGPAVQCGPGAFWPSLGQLGRADLVIVAELDGSPVGAVLTALDGHISWMLTKPGHTGEAFAALYAAVVERCGDAFGRVENESLRGAYLAAQPMLVELDSADPAEVGLRR